jgi:hypothetical protein
LILSNVLYLTLQNKLQQITGSFTVQNTISLSKLESLSSLKSVRGLTVRNNNILLNIDDFSSLVCFKYKIILLEQLIDFCALINVDFQCSTNITNNAFNPTEQYLIDGNCS